METSEMSAEGMAVLAELEEQIDAKASKWMEEVLPAIYEQLEKCAITYNEDILCEALNDGFRAGYFHALKDADINN